MHCYLPVFLGLFEPLIQDLTRSKGSLHFKYHLVCCFVNATIRLRLEFSLSSLTINSHRGQILRFHKILKPSTRTDDYMRLCNNITQSHKNSIHKVQSHLKFFKFKVALNPTYRIFLNFAKSCILSCLSKVDNIKNFTVSFLNYKPLEL